VRNAGHIHETEGIEFRSANLKYNGEVFLRLLLCGQRSGTDSVRGVLPIAEAGVASAIAPGAPTALFTGSEDVTCSFSSSASIFSCCASARALGFELLHLVLHQAAKVLQFAFDDGICRLRSLFWLVCHSHFAAHRKARFLLAASLASFADRGPPQDSYSATLLQISHSFPPLDS